MKLSICFALVSFVIGIGIYAVVFAVTTDNRDKPVIGTYNYNKATKAQFLVPFGATFALFTIVFAVVMRRRVVGTIPDTTKKTE